MPTRVCANCGTEVDADAAFCPTCGQPLDDGVTAEIPPAPAWPQPEPEPESEPEPEPEPEAEPAPPAEEPPPGVPEPGESETVGFRREQPAEPSPEPQAPPQPPSPPPAVPPRRPARGSASLSNITWPVTLSEWLMGGGALAAALGGLLELFGGFRGNAMNLLVMVAMLGVAALVFLSASLPPIPHRRLWVLVVSLLATGLALDRFGFNGAGIATVLVFLGAGAAAIGVILADLGRDRPISGPAGR